MVSVPGLSIHLILSDFVMGKKSLHGIAISSVQPDVLERDRGRKRLADAGPQAALGTFPQDSNTEFYVGSLAREPKPVPWMRGWKNPEAEITCK